jgi:hypothetical protein
MNKLCSKWQIKSLLFAGLCFLVYGGTPATAADSAPDWVRQLAHSPLPKYPEEAEGVVLLDDETLTVKDNGEMYVNYRRVLKILRPAGKERSWTSSADGALLRLGKSTN